MEARCLGRRTLLADPTLNCFLIQYLHPRLAQDLQTALAALDAPHKWTHSHVGVHFLYRQGEMFTVFPEEIGPCLYQCIPPTQTR